MEWGSQRAIVQGLSHTTTPLGKKSDDFKSSTLALLACPNKTAICGNKREFTFADSAATKATVTISDLTQDDQCGYLIKATCDYPMVKIDATSGDDIHKFLEMRYLEYQQG